MEETNNPLEQLKAMVDIMIEREYDNSTLRDVMLDVIGGLAYLNTEGRYIFANKYYYESFGYTEEELINSMYIKMVHHDDLPILTQAYWEMMDKGKSDCTFRGIKKDGTVFNKRVIMVKRFNSKGQCIGCYSFMRVLD